MKKILIIDDHKDPRLVFSRDIADLGGQTIHVDAPDEIDVRGFTKNLTKRLGLESYDGTILDIIFVREPRGGIELWERLDELGLAEKCGKILVVSNNAHDQDIQEFAAKVAEGRICGELGSARLRRLRVQEFLDAI